MVFVQQRVPATAPDHFDHVPAGGAVQAFELLDHLGVAAHGAVQALQVAVDHEDQVVEFLAPGQGNGGQGFRLIHFTITEEGPDLASLVLLEAAQFQVAHKARLVSGGDGAEAHGHGRELPEIRHQPRVRVGRQALTVDFLAEVVHLIFADATRP